MIPINPEMIKAIIEDKRRDMRDEFAKSMPHDSIPVLTTKESYRIIAEEMGFNILDFDNALEMIDFAAQYEAWYRYKYADAMVKQRG